MAQAPVLQIKYRDDVVPQLQQEFGYDNMMQIPRVEKIVVNIGLGEALDNPKALDSAIEDLRQITGQQPIVTRARKSIANFKLREGRAIGAKVTLRGERMYDFFDKMVNAVLPRTHEFQGIPADAFDGRGNYTLGFKEQTLFPEIDYDKIDKVRGLEISIVTTAEKDEDGRHLLEMLGMPFEKGGAG